MMFLLYRIAIRLFGLIMRLLSLLHSKSREWVSGRKNWSNKLKNDLKGQSDLIWVHCSSLGEFEQGRPVIEALHSRGEKILLTFFSPSGYRHARNYNLAVAVHYLPLDTASNARRFLEIVQPKAAVFVKYEFWYNFIRACHQHSVPLILISGIFHRDHYFFKFYGKWFSEQLTRFDLYFAQNEPSAERAKSIGIQHVFVSGDTRFDRVLRIHQEANTITSLDKIDSNVFTLVAGSTWPADEELIQKAIEDLDFPIRLILVPHEINPEHIRSIQKKFPESILFSKYGDSESFKTLIVDSMGLLSRIYRYADIAFIGGGFGKGIHNSLEAAVYGIPVIFGPNHERFREAIDLVRLNGAHLVESPSELNKLISDLKSNQPEREKQGQTNSDYVKEQSGATQVILQEMKRRQLIR